MDIESSYMYRIIKHLVAGNIIGPADSVLLVCGGPFDEAVFSLLGFEHVLCTNIDPDQLNKEKPVVQDVRNLSYPDSMFDCVIAHASLHHVDRPHQAVCEMYRVAKKIVLFIEAQDSLLMRLAVRYGLVPEYEMNAIRDSGGLSGGVNGTPIPNYVYRWTKREVEKTIRSLDPVREPNIMFFTEWDFYWRRIARRLSKSPLRVFPEQALSSLAWVGVKAANLFVGGQGNLLAVCIRKDTTHLWPWIVDEGGTFSFRDPGIQKASQGTRTSGIVSSR